MGVAITIDPFQVVFVFLRFPQNSVFICGFQFSTSIFPMNSIIFFAPVFLLSSLQVGYWNFVSYPNDEGPAVPDAYQHFKERLKNLHRIATPEE